MQFLCYINFLEVWESIGGGHASYLKKKGGKSVTVHLIKKIAPNFKRGKDICADKIVNSTKKNNKGEN